MLTTTYLFSTLHKEGVWIQAVGDCVTNEWKPMENDRRVNFLSKESLLNDVQGD